MQPGSGTRSRRSDRPALFENAACFLLPSHGKTRERRTQLYVGMEVGQELAAAGGTQRAGAEKSESNVWSEQVRVES